MVRRAVFTLGFLLFHLAAAAASLVVNVRDVRGGVIDDAVAWAVPVGRRIPAPTRPAVMDQKNRQFVPRILVIQTGTAVSFPNSDNVRHQVYSFSPAKKFQLPLYEGTPSAPVVFDLPGVVTLGCNIHDRMSAFIIVVDTPHFAVATKGKATIAELPAGEYEVRIWHPGLREATNPKRARLEAGGALEVTFTAGSE
ncbi:MAG: methylamine utilization protein [Acidobacteria bacterium]|nr:methylamine utilization protein [Acidobacteriota bacterium]